MPTVQIMELKPVLHPKYLAKCWHRKVLAVMVDGKIFHMTKHFNGNTKGPKSNYRKYMAECEAEKARIQKYIDLGVIQ